MTDAVDAGLPQSSAVRERALTPREDSRPSTPTIPAPSAGNVAGIPSRCSRRPGIRHCAGSDCRAIAVDVRGASGSRTTVIGLATQWTWFSTGNVRALSVDSAHQPRLRWAREHHLRGHSPLRRDRYQPRSDADPRSRVLGPRGRGDSPEAVRPTPSSAERPVGA